MIEIDYRDIIEFWFADEHKAKWFIKDPEFDKEITSKFLSYYESAINGQLDHWKDSPESTLALIILLDQFSRNMFRNTPKSFATDIYALSLAKYAIDQKMDEALSNDSKQFLYMPLMHSENLEDQKLCFDLFAYNPQSQHYSNLG